MVYRRSYGYRKRRFVKPRQEAGLSKLQQALSIAKKAYTGVKYLKYLVNAEKKFHDYTTTANVDWAGNLFQMADIDQGDTGNTRDGNQIAPRSIQNTLRLRKHASATDTLVRMILFEDLQADYNLPTTITTVLQDDTTTKGVISPINSVLVSRFRILRDKRYILNTDRPELLVKDFHNLGNHYKYADGTGTNYVGRTLFMILISDEETNVPAIEFYSRIRFMDN